MEELCEIKHNLNILGVPFMWIKLVRAKLIGSAQSKGHSRMARPRRDQRLSANGLILKINRPSELCVRCARALQFI